MTRYHLNSTVPARRILPVSLAGVAILRRIAAVLPVLLLAATTLAADSGQERVPRRTESKAEEVVNFSLLDYAGKYYELRRADARVVVLFFTSFNCNNARASVPKLRNLRNQYAAQGVALWLVNSSTHEDPDDSLIQMLVGSRGKALGPEPTFSDSGAMRAELLKGLVGNLPVLRDDLQVVAHRLGVTRTCEILAIDTKTMTVIYRGALDDQNIEGAQKSKATENYLSVALDEFLAGKPVTTPKTQVQGCPITFTAATSTQPVSYSREIAPLLQKHCVICHSPGQIGPFSMSSYKKVQGWSAMIEEVLLDRRMPPWHADPHYGKFVNDRALTPAETHSLLAWIEQGCPRGEGEDPLLTVPPTPATWTLGQPDFIVPLPKTQEIPATGTQRYRYLDSDFEMPQDAWLRAAVCRPGNPKVVHHIIVRVRYPAGYHDAPAESYLFTSWVPGLAAGEFPAGTGMFLPKGSRFNFEVHYTTMGEATTDLSEVGLYVAEKPAARRLEVRASETRDFEIPPGVADADHYCFYCFKRDAIIYDLSPHMHLRGSWFRFQLLLPDGNRETLLNVPNYDFNWQTSYRLAEPRHVKAGTWMLCTGGHDNSPKNPNNPDATKSIRWGLQSWDEMFMGFMTVADDHPPETALK